MADIAALTKSMTADGVVSPHDGLYFGYVVTTAMSANASPIYDNASAASGTIIDVIPASAAIGAKSGLTEPVRCKNGIYIDVGGTGTVTLYYS